MTIGQILLYHNLGVEMKYGKKGNGEKSSVRNMSYDQVKQLREEMRQQGLIDEKARSDAKKEKYRAKYGDV